jgi:rhodanese-related sulfurtransferase
VTDTSAPLTVDEFAPRRGSATVIDVRTPGEYGSGHIPGAFNIPLDRLDDALPALRTAAANADADADADAKGGLVVVCASGTRSGVARDRLADAGIAAASLDGGTEAWARGGHALDRPAGARAVWPMERQVRLVAGSLVVLGILLDLAIPGARILSFLIGGGLVFSALSNTCGMAAVLSKLPYNRRRPDDAGGLDATLRRLADGARPNPGTS